MSDARPAVASAPLVTIRDRGSHPGMPWVALCPLGTDPRPSGPPEVWAPVFDESVAGMG